MRIFTMKTMAAMAVVGLIVGSAADLQAEDESEVGIIHISDKLVSIQKTQSRLVSLSGFNSVSWNSGGDSSNGCGPKGCGSRHCCFGGCYGRGNTVPSPLCVWLHPHGGCTHSPDYGWSRPTKIPIQRAPVEYRRYSPTKRYGEPGSAFSQSRQFPMVYMPTDTTQLGFYYQRVPQWRPNPAMIPTRPWPSVWHNRECPDYRSPGCSSCSSSTAAVETSVPATDDSAAPEPAYEELPEALEPPLEAPTQLDRSALNRDFRSTLD